MIVSILLVLQLKFINELLLYRLAGLAFDLSGQLYEAGVKNMDT